MKSVKKDMESVKCQMYAPTVLRVALGLLFVLPGIMKLLNPNVIIGMLGQLGFPAAMFFGWVVIIVEVVGGLMLITGLKTKFAIVPLIVVMLVAIFTVVVPQLIVNPMAAVSLLFHLLAVAGLVSVYLSGPGSCSVKV